MTDRRIFDLISLTGLVIAGVAVWDMLEVWGHDWLQPFFFIYAMAMFVALGVVLLFKRANAYFSTVCGQRPRLTGLRMLLAAALFFLGWYVNAAMGARYGSESSQVAYNSARIFALTATLLAHVFYAAFVHRAKKSGG